MTDVLNGQPHSAGDGMVGFAQKANQELSDILNWWRCYSIDEENNGFYGEIDNNNRPISGADKGLVLNARILWTYAAAFNFRKDQEDLKLATRAFNYLVKHFYDAKNLGFYWAVTASGDKKDGKKQVYGQAFTIYGLAEYAKASGNEQALELAKETFEVLEQYSLDKEYGGYLEAFNEEWGKMGDLRLSDKDMNTEKSMNTHLHVVEAYARLYQVWQTDRLKQAIKDLLYVFYTHIINQDWHLELFFDRQWVPQSNTISYGHDIEAAWLLQECAEILEDQEEIDRFSEYAMSIASAAAEGLEVGSGMIYELDSEEEVNREKHWWVQAEAVVGFFNAYQLSGQTHFLKTSKEIWDYIDEHIKDKSNGEWHWGIKPNGEYMNESKASFWKCPYHNSRACLEIIKRA